MQIKKNSLWLRRSIVSCYSVLSFPRYNMHRVWYCSKILFYWYQFALKILGVINRAKKKKVRRPYSDETKYPIAMHISYLNFWLLIFEILINCVWLFQDLCLKFLGWRATVNFKKISFRIVRSKISMIIHSLRNEPNYFWPLESMLGVSDPISFPWWSFFFMHDNSRLIISTKACTASANWINRPFF
jgi:hypothetical protein